MKRIKLLLLIGLSLVALSETYLRAFHYEALKKLKRDVAYIPDPLYGYRYKPNSAQHLVWPDVDKKFRFNNHGYYGPDFSATKDPETYRIIFVGSSNTLGLKVDSNDNFVMKLQDLFRQNGYDVEVINCSVDGGRRGIYNINIAKYQIEEFSPDLVMFESKLPIVERHLVRGVYKDVMLTAELSNMSFLHLLDDEIDKIDESVFLRNLYDASYIVRQLCRSILEHDGGSVVRFIDSHILQIKWIRMYVRKDGRFGDLDANKTELTIDESIKAYSDLEDYLSSLNIKLLTYSIQKPQQVYSEIYPRFIVGENITNEMILPHDGHLNEKGHTLIAEDLFRLLMNYSLPLRNYKKAQNHTRSNQL